ncbi:MAG: hypothetical protein DME94_11620 [Verrucomicrobia bacterium]|nr:MAG: hypothetical protein DME94_11620 [Verrucomicrobiota bacterium]
MKPVAARINAAVPPDEHLYAINLPFLPYLFYVRCPVTYLEKLADLPPDARYFLVPPSYQKKITKTARLGHARPLVWTPTYPPTFRGGESILFVIGEF